MSAMTEVPKHGTKVRRKLDDKLFTTGYRHSIGLTPHVRLHPVRDGRTHDKREDLFLEQFKLEE